uniref:Uncharacterized protein n=1 Tax=Laticauda laticaudata TaxID=8630 RepID=A0A8C5WWH1_LATLA
MSESSAKSSQPLSAKQDKDVSEKRGRGRPRKQPQVCTVFSFPHVIRGSFCKMLAPKQQYCLRVVYFNPRKMKFPSRDYFS